jgi:hypothetical protein
MIKPLAVAADDSFETLLLTELEIVRSGKERLERLFPKLRHHPQLKECFLQELAEVQQRANRLDAILNGTATFENIPAACQLPAA